MAVDFQLSKLFFLVSFSTDKVYPYDSLSSLSYILLSTLSLRIYPFAVQLLGSQQYMSSHLFANTILRFISTLMLCIPFLFRIRCNVLLSIITNQSTHWHNYEYWVASFVCLLPSNDEMDQVRINSHIAKKLWFYAPYIRLSMVMVIFHFYTLIANGSRSFIIATYDMSSV